MSLAAALGRRRSSADGQPTRRISGPVEGSFVHLNGTQDLNSSQVVASASPIFSPMRAASPELVKSAKSRISRRLTKSFTSPFLTSSPQQLSPSLISAPIPIAASRAPVVPTRPIRSDKRMTFNGSATSISPPSGVSGYVPHHLRNASLPLNKISSSESQRSTANSTPALSSSATSTPGLAFSPRTPGSNGQPKRIARKPVPTMVAFSSPFGPAGDELSLMPDMDFGNSPTLTLSAPFDTSKRRQSTAADLEGGLFAPPSESCRDSTCSSSSSLTSVGRAGALLIAGFSSPKMRSGRLSPSLSVPDRPYELGSSPALPELPTTPSLEDSLRNSPILGNIREECHTPASSCSAYSSCVESETDSDEVLVVPRLSVSSSRTSASEGSSSGSHQRQTGWRWGHSNASEQENASGMSGPYEAFHVGTPSMEESRGKNAKRSSVWLPTRVQSNGKMYNISPVIGSLSPVIAEEAWGQHGKRVEEWSGDVLEITLSPRV